MIAETEKKRLKKLLGDNFSFDVPLLDYTSWQTGGPADILYAPQTVEDLLIAAKDLCPKYPFHILGHGTNTLFSDEGYRGVIFCLRDSFQQIKTEGNKAGRKLIRCGSGAGSFCPYSAA